MYFDRSTLISTDVQNHLNATLKLQYYECVYAELKERKESYTFQKYSLI